MSNRKYEESFKRMAVDLCRQEGKGVASVERELGLPKGTLRGWVNRYSPQGEADAAERSELQRLKRELAEAKLENEILKKAMGFFARSQP